MTAASGTKLEISMVRRSVVVGSALVLMAGLAAVSGVSRAGDLPAGLADPTRPSYIAESHAAGTAPRRGPVLESTFVSASQRRALISGRSYAVGDNLGGAVITDIQPYEVVLRQAGRESRLRLLPRLVKEESIVKVPVKSQEGGNEK